MADDYADYLQLARRLAVIAEDQIMPRFDRVAVMAKEDGSEVTEADRIAEEVIRDVLARECPDHGVWGEEYGGGFEPSRRFTWIIDPIDGTANFTLGLANFGVLIGLTDGQEPVVGMVHFPALGWSLFASKGHGCFYQRGSDEPVRVRVQTVETIAEAAGSSAGARASDMMLGFTETRYKLANLVDSSRKFRFVGDCLQHALVCRGRLQIAIDPVLKAWDMAALIPCIIEAGGVACALDGSPIDLATTTSLVSTCGGSIHDKLITMIGLNSVI